MKAVALMPMTDAEAAALRARLAEGVRFVVPAERTEEALVAACRDASAVVGAEHLGAVLAACPSVRLVQVTSAGAAYLVEHARAHPEVAFANAHANAYVTAQYGVALLLALVNRLREGDAVVREGRWARRDEAATPANLGGRTVLVLGTGHIGRWAAQLLGALGMRVVGLKRTPAPAAPPFDAVVTAAALLDAAREADVLFVTLPGTGATRGLVGAAVLEALGPDGWLVNVGRGSVVDEEALYRALAGGRIAGAAVDVWYDYDPEAGEDGRAYPYSRPFHRLGNVLLSPHRAGTTDPPPDYWADVAENLNRLAQGRTDFIHRVDAERGY